MTASVYVRFHQKWYWLSLRTVLALIRAPLRANSKLAYLKRNAGLDVSATCLLQLVYLFTKKTLLTSQSESPTSIKSGQKICHVNSDLVKATNPVWRQSRRANKQVGPERAIHEFHAVYNGANKLSRNGHSNIVASKPHATAT